MPEMRRDRLECPVVLRDEESEFRLVLAKARILTAKDIHVEIGCRQDDVLIFGRTWPLRIAIWRSASTASHVPMEWAMTVISLTELSLARPRQHLLQRIGE